MAFFRITRESPLSAAEAWRRMTDWERHGDVVPLTRVRLATPPPTGEGTVFVPRTGVGRLTFDDPMEVVDWAPPYGDSAGRCRLEKRGTFVTGWAEIEVAPYGAGSLVAWREEIRVGPLPRWCDPLLARAGRMMFGHAVKKLLQYGT
ncbi:SRPBCC family protein [Streptomyces sp. NPDC001939]|uniref:SRPBCC family protein n=1 Tax=Streptomyces TaxID=1883 RepID=UPI001D0AA1D7|nr:MULTISPECIES: SRPBCC family protein [Streptomyces]MCX5086045.1 SRPBCC family protein [Streptomyces sp. NBC_00401]UDM02878.1 SRPBCC family protein [Streptomyces longhuiensis]